MGGIHLMLKNLGRKKTRTLLTLLSVVVAFVLLTMLFSLNRAFSLGLDLAGADRLITMHRVSFIQPVPLAYVNRIEAIEGVDYVGHYTWMGGYYQDPRQQFGLFPTRIETLPDIYPEYEIPDEQWQRLLETRTGLLVGEAMMNAYDWELGQRIPLGSTIYPQQGGSHSWEFDIVATFRGAADGADEMQAFAHYEYFNEARSFGRDTVGWIVTRVADPDRSEEIARTIDQRFANSPTETKTSSEEGWISGFVAQFGNIGLMVRAILACVFFTLLLVAGNTMAQAVRERTNELAVMKTLGFSDFRLMWMVLGESLMLALVGAGLGLMLGNMFISGARAALAQFMPGLGFPADAYPVAIGLAVMLGVLTGIVPALRAMRLQVVAALARR